MPNYSLSSICYFLRSKHRCKFCWRQSHSYGRWTRPPHHHHHRPVKEEGEVLGYTATTKPEIPQHHRPNGPSVEHHPSPPPHRQTPNPPIPSLHQHTTSTSILLHLKYHMNRSCDLMEEATANTHNNTVGLPKHKTGRVY